ncbi:MAG: hypothetical protein UY62_C0009G0024 [Parcubacteria group bacterium GW2011_GWF2_50_9]|nr:MAG: hypothetical protein UY62_C0009G0024 [Parcubacteria group bacterium GW2011_GWF2_50_9]
MAVTHTMTFDTNILIAYLDKEEPAFSSCKRYKELGVPFILPAIVEAELLAYLHWSMEQRNAVERFLEDNFVFVPLDRAVARMTAEIRRQTRLKSPDAAIAATALFTNTPLVTRNVRDFKKVPGLQAMTL